MLPSIRSVLTKFKVQGGAQLGTDEELQQLCRQMGLSWRERLLTPIVTLRLFFLQVLHGNVALNALPHIAGFSFTSSAYCEARQRLPLELLQRLLRQGHPEGARDSAPGCRRPLARASGVPGGCHRLHTSGYAASA